MKILCTILMALFISCSMSAKTYALLTGVSNYDGTSHDLSQSTKDAKSMNEFYKQRGATTSILTSKYATHDNIIAVIRKMAKKATAGDDVIFYYSGHGAPDAIYTHDGNNNPPLAYSEIISELSKCKCRRIIVYIDACFSGTASSAVTTKDFNPDTWKTMMKEKGNYIMMLSSKDSETSGESGLVGAGFFTRALLKALKGSGDRNHDKRMTVNEVFRYVYNDVLRHSKNKQHPQLVTPKGMREDILIDWN